MIVQERKSFEILSQFFLFFFFLLVLPILWLRQKEVDQSKNETFCLLSRLSFHEIFINFDCYANVIAHLIPHRNDIEKKL